MIILETERVVGRSQVEPEYLSLNPDSGTYYLRDLGHIT